MGRSRLRFLGASCALGLVLAIVAGSVFAGVAKAATPGTTLTVLSGDVFSRHADGEFALANDGDVLDEGDVVRTNDTGRAVLTYFDGSTVTVEPSTQLSIDAASSLADHGKLILMTQWFGRTWHVVQKLLTGDSRYEVRTPSSTASVRGTEFQVDASASATTLTTTEGLVAQQIPDPDRPGATVEVKVAAGTVQTQQRNAAPELARTAPEPERVLTVQVAAANTLVVDPLGRTNGVTSDGKVVAQTPGAKVQRTSAGIVVLLPGLPDGKIATRVDGDAASVTTTVTDRGTTSTVTDTTKGAGQRKSTGVDVRRDASGNAQARPLDQTELENAPAPKVTGSGAAPASAPSAPASTPSAPASTAPSSAAPSSGAPASSAPASGAPVSSAPANTTVTPPTSSNAPSNLTTPPPVVTTAASNAASSAPAPVVEPSKSGPSSASTTAAAAQTRPAELTNAVASTHDSGGSPAQKTGAAPPAPSAVRNDPRRDPDVSRHVARH